MTQLFALVSTNGWPNGGIGSEGRCWPNLMVVINASVSGQLDD